MRYKCAVGGSLVGMQQIPVNDSDGEERQDDGKRGGRQERQDAREASDDSRVCDASDTDICT